MKPVSFDYSVNDLKAIYERENEVLQSRLLNGELWEQVKDQRQKVTELSIALHKKLQASLGAHPAESPSSDVEGR